MGVFALVAILILRIKRHDAGSAPGHVNFDGYNEGELIQRGVFNKTKWH